MYKHATKRLLRINDAAEYSSLSRSTLYAASRAGELVLVKIGSATRIERAELDRWLDSRIKSGSVVAWPQPLKRQETANG